MNAEELLICQRWVLRQRRFIRVLARSDREAWELLAGHRIWGCP